MLEHIFPTSMTGMMVSRI